MNVMPCRVLSPAGGVAMDRVVRRRGGRAGSWLLGRLGSGLSSRGACGEAR